MDLEVWKAAFMNDATPEQLEVVIPRLVPCPLTTTVVVKAHESLFCWSQWALLVHDAAHDAFMTLPPHNTSREDDVRPVVEGARTGRADDTRTPTHDRICCTAGSHPCGG